jgi:hypothetical protein
MTDKGTVVVCNDSPYSAFIDGSVTHIRSFDDGSCVMYYDNGRVTLCAKPRNAFDENRTPPKAYLYYWRVEQNTPGVSTWEDIKRAEHAE